MNKLLGFLYVMLLFLMMAGPAFGWNGCSNCDCRQSVPEPSTMLLLGSGILTLMVYGGKKIKK